MGTTATVLLIAGGGDHLRGFIAHVGDSRVYLARQNQCHVLTEDHSLMNELVRRGKLNREQIESSPYKQYKNAVTRAVGVYGSVEVDTFDFDILPGDRFLLCSDGMYAYVDEDELPKQLADGEVKDVPEELVELANAGGGHDNITAVVVRIGETSSTELAPRTTEVSLKLEVLKGMQMFRYLSYKELVRIAQHRRDDRAVDRPGDLLRRPAGRRDVRRAVGRACGSTKGDTAVAELEPRPALRRDGAGRPLGALADRRRAAEGTRLVVIHRKDFYEIIKREPGARQQDAVELRPGARRRGCARPPTTCPTRCTAIATARRPRPRTCSRTEGLDLDDWPRGQGPGRRPPAVHTHGPELLVRRSGGAA